MVLVNFGVFGLRNGNGGNGIGNSKGNENENKVIGMVIKNRFGLRDKLLGIEKVRERIMAKLPSYF